MDFELTDEQTWLAESVDELLARASGDDGIVTADQADSAWAALVEFGGLDVGADDDGLGAVELALVARKLGERLAAVPFIDTAALRYAVAPDPAVLDAGAVALGLAEPGRGFAPLESTATLVDALVSGEKTGVTLADRVDSIALTATGPDGAALVVVGSDDPAVTITPGASIDSSLRPGHVRLDGASGIALPANDLSRVIQTASVLAAAEAAGAAATVLALAVEYAGQRRQFGRMIGSFQAVRHLLADAVVGVESSWSSVLYAAASLDEHEPDAERTVSITKAWTSRATLDVAQTALQIFGGVAFTAEHPAHRFLRRIAALGGLHGTAAEHERALGRTLARPLEVIA